MYAEKLRYQPDAPGVLMRVRNSSSFRGNTPGHKRDAHRSLAHDNEGTATPQNLCHMRTCVRCVAFMLNQQTGLKTSDTRAAVASPRPPHRLGER